MLHICISARGCCLGLRQELLTDDAKQATEANGILSSTSHGASSLRDLQNGLSTETARSREGPELIHVVLIERWQHGSCSNGSFTGL